MTRDEVLGYCLAKPGAWQDEPWEGDVVAEVGSKIFAFVGTGGRSGAAPADQVPRWPIRCRGGRG
jgi:predicted DNA-binding protein (MmcQ/YjbR family)